MELSPTDQFLASGAVSQAPNPDFLTDRHNGHVLQGIDNDDGSESPLCEDCKLILAKFPNAQAEVEKPSEAFFSTTKAKVEAQAANGCDLCKWFLKFGNLLDDRELECKRAVVNSDEQSLWIGGGEALLTRKLTISELNEGDVK